jgi:23S rRNA (guanosine2251-2'-O)-methyltransferase
VNAVLANSRRRCQRLFATQDAAASVAAHASLTLELVDRTDLEVVLPRHAVHQGVAVLADPLEEPALEEACLPLAAGRNIVVALDHVTDPQNIGAILRSAAAFGARALVLTDRHAPPVTGALAKAASGAVETVPMVRAVNLARALDQLAEAGYWRVGLDGTATTTLAEAPIAGPGANVVLVLGAEGTGLRRLTREHCDIIAKLPITDRVESLNVSAAAAAALYELVRDPV